VEGHPQPWALEGAAAGRTLTATLANPWVEVEGHPHPRALEGAAAGRTLTATLANPWVEVVGHSHPWALEAALGRSLTSHKSNSKEQLSKAIRLLLSVASRSNPEVLPLHQWASNLVEARWDLARQAPLANPRCLHLLQMCRTDMAVTSTVVNPALMGSWLPWGSQANLQNHPNVLVPSRCPLFSARCERKGRTLAECSSAASVPKGSSASSFNLPMSRLAQMCHNRANRLNPKAHHVHVVCPARS